jgi:hypothetical protein
LDAKETLIEHDKTRNVEDRIRHELMQLHVVHKEKPMPKFMGRKKRPRKRKAMNITRNLASGHGTTSSPDILTSVVWEIKPAFRSLRRLVPKNSDMVQPDAWPLVFPWHCGRIWWTTEFSSSNGRATMREGAERKEEDEFRQHKRRSGEQQ